MSNFKNAVRIQEMVEENADLKMQIKTLKDLQSVDKRRILVDKNKIENQKLELEIGVKMINQLEMEIRKLEGENEALLEELDILKNYFKLKL